jgi:hypothetical protein
MRTMIIAVAAMAAALSGCRREDVREFTVEIPGLTQENRQKVVDAFTVRKPGQPPHVYEGIRPDTFSFDFGKRTLTMKYDSMKIAKTNIRMLIEAAGVEVHFPSNNASGVAGYLDYKPASAD